MFLLSSHQGESFGKAFLALQAVSVKAVYLATEGLVATPIGVTP
jgi:hypothetical protein